MLSYEYLKNVVSLTLEENRCIGCLMCTMVCPHGVFEIVSGRARITYRDRCMECGACATNCPVEAIKVASGVGCAQAVLNSITGRNGKGCCCTIDNPATSRIK
ncbi:MAG: mercury methylation ferredoxin HgcB [Desulfobulbaceae bacterium]|nr:mercury methylation ferredoxin HgcB [Desulfobulbaceae bacterium]